MKSRIQYYFILILSILIVSCNYPLKKENFKDIKPPSDIVYFDLNLIPENDTIEIFTETELNYGIDAPGLNILHIEYSINNTTYELYNPSGEISITPGDYSPGYYNFKISFVTNSGSGSVADETGYEGYLSYKEWTLVIDNRPPPRLIPEKSITEKGFIKISWPICDQYNFEAYEFRAGHGGNVESINITDQNKNFYIDSLYVAGDFNVTLNCRVAYLDGNPVHMSFYEEPPQLNFENIGYDSLNIYWNKTNYNAKYRLIQGNDSIYYFETNNDTSLTIGHPGLGSRTYFGLCTNSIYNEWPNPSQYCNLGSSAYYSIGTYIAGNFPEFAYNHQEKVFYTNTYDDMECYDIFTFDLLNAVDLQDLLYKGNYSCPTNSSKVATVTSDHIYIFNDKTLTNPNIFSYGLSGAFSFDHFLLTDNNYLAFAKEPVYYLFDTETHEAVITIDIDDYPFYSKWACITTSQDAKFACIVTRNGLKLYNLENGTANLVYNDTRAYLSAYFNPYNTNELFLSLDDNPNIEIRDPNDFSLIKTTPMPSETVIQNIDPVTNYLLATDYTKIYITDPVSDEIKFSMNCNSSKFRFYNYVLFSKRGYILNISDAF